MRHSIALELWETSVKVADRNRIRWLCILVAAMGHSYFAATSHADSDGPQLVLPLGHSDYIKCVALSADGTGVLTGSSDRTAILWDVATAKPIQTFKGHKSSVISVALSARL